MSRPVRSRPTPTQSSARWGAGEAVVRSDRLNMTDSREGGQTKNCVAISTVLHV
jgi:hypothetical protein